MKTGSEFVNKESVIQKPAMPKLNMKKLESDNVLTLQKLDFTKKKGAGAKKIKDFQDEFMDKYEEYSLSWRAAINKERRF